MNSVNVFGEMSKIRKNKTDFFASNIYGNPPKIDMIEQSGNAIAYGYDDKGVFRVYFAGNNADELNLALKKFPKGSSIEILCDEMDERLERILTEAGFGRYAVYLRETIHNIKEDIYKNIPDKYKNIKCWDYIRYAKPEDAKEIYDLLYHFFRPITSHLQNMDELMEEIKKNQVVVALEDDHVVGLIIYKYQGKKIYIEHIINTGPSVFMHALYMALLEKALADGINVAYTWTRDDNSRALALTKRYGYEIDKIKNFVFEKKW